MTKLYKGWSKRELKGHIHGLRAQLESEQSRNRNLRSQPQELKRQLEAADDQIAHLTKSLADKVSKWQYSDISVAVSETGLCRLSYMNVEAYVRPGATVLLEAKDGKYSYPPIPIGIESDVVDPNSGAVEENAMPVKDWQVQVITPGSKRTSLRVVAHTEDGAMNRASDQYNLEYGRRPHDSELWGLEEITETP